MAKEFKDQLASFYRDLPDPVAARLREYGFVESHGATILRDAAVALLEHPDQMDRMLVGLPLVFRLALITKLRVLTSLGLAITDNAPPIDAVFLNEGAREATSELLADLFGADELKRFVRKCPLLGDRIWQRLPGATESPAAVFDVATAVFAQNGFLQKPEFWAYLNAERPGRGARIRTVEALVRGE